MSLNGFKQITIAGAMILAIAIENPTGAWLQVGGLNTFVPPHTLGYQANFAVPQSSVTVTAVATPPGGVASDFTGSPIATLTAYDGNIEENSGEGYDLLPAIQTLSGNLTTVHNDLVTLHTDLSVTLHADLTLLHTDIATTLQISSQ